MFQVLSLSLCVVAPGRAQEPDAAEGVDAEKGAASEGIEDLIVTARKREEPLQEVPISVTVLTGVGLENQNIDDAMELQFKVPNLSFSKTNFTGSNIQIRGIGTQVVATTGEPAVGVHVNTVPVTSSRLFEQEFYDVESVEVLRGPQGTLFGRNSTGGSFNISTRRPTDALEAGAELTIGNYDQVKVKGMINSPIGDRLRMRFAGLFDDRDGDIDNLGTGNDINDRHLYGVRGSFQLDVTEQTRADLMVSWFDEEDHRSRIGKQLCTSDDSPSPFSLGCSGDSLGFGSITSYATLRGILESYALALSFGQPPLYPLGVDSAADSFNPPNLRKHNARIDPDYEADELLITLDLHHDFDELAVDWVTGYQDTSVTSVQDHSGIPSLAWDPDAIENLDTVWGLASAEGFTELCLGRFGCRDRGFSEDRSTIEATQISTELRAVSDFDSPLNFTAGVSYVYYSAHSEYFVFFSGGEVIARMRQALNPAYDLELAHFLNETDPTITNSVGLFGEGYWEITDSTKLTLGLRYTHDDKTARSRTSLLDSSGSKPPFDKQEESWDAGTGRITLAHDLDFGWAAQSMLFTSVSRGYKPGGFNPPAATIFDVPGTFDPETLWAYELGAKNMFFDNRLQANITGFFYDYQDYQVPQMVARTAVNDNIDSYLWGFEAEFLAMPREDVLINFNVAYLGSSIQNTESVDPSDPSAGNPDWTAVKDLSNGSNTITSNPGDPLNSAFWHPDGGLPKDLDGNELPNVPNWQINIGAQYTLDDPWGGSLTSRISYYWQSEMYSRMFNEKRDKIDSWSQLDASMRYQEPSGHVYIDVWAKNLTDNDDITGQYLSDASSGLFTNTFILPPRTYGITVGATF